MRELLACWQSTRMIVLIGLCAALYSVTSASFKFLTVIPGITEIRPGACIPIVFSVFFGPVAAWGSAFGNIIGDVIGGTIGPGSLFGMPGNFLYGYIPYRIIRSFGASSSNIITPRKFHVFIFAAFVASAACATIIATGIHFLKLFPFDLVEHTIVINNTFWSLVLASLLIRGLDKRIRQMKLNYEQLLDPDQISKPLFGIIGSILLLVLIVLVYACIMFPGFAGGLSGMKGFELIAVTIIIIASLLLL
jgi:energy-coupling factor transport system substrate-specific component